MLGEWFSVVLSYPLCLVLSVFRLDAALDMEETVTGVYTGLEMITVAQSCDYHVQENTSRRKSEGLLTLQGLTNK